MKPTVPTPGRERLYLASGDGIYGGPGKHVNPKENLPKPSRSASLSTLLATLGPRCPQGLHVITALCYLMLQL